MSKTDDEILSDVIERVERGVPAHREIKASEILPVIRAACMWRTAAMNLWADKVAMQKDSMSLGPPKVKRGQ